MLDPETSIQSCQKARAHERMGEYEEARLALGDFDIGSWPDTEGMADETKAEVLLRTGSLTSCLGSSDAIKEAQEHARNLLTHAQEIFFALGCTAKRAECFNAISVSYWREGRTSDALVYISAALDCTSETSGEERAIALINRAIIYKAQFRYREALKDLRRVAPLVKLLNSDYSSGVFHHTTANINKAIAEAEGRPELLDVAITHNTSALIHFEQCGHRRYRTRVETTLGNLYRATGMPSEAETHLLNAKRVAGSLKDVSLDGQIDVSLAQLYYDQGREFEAERHARQAARKLEETGERLLEAEAHETLAKILRGSN